MDMMLAAAQNGLATQSFLITQVADNLANVNTAGYGRRITAATGGGGTMVRPPGVVMMGTGLLPSASVPAPVQSGVDVPTFSQGMTGVSSPTALAVAGSGFFQVQLPSGQLGYTRAGSFRVDANGQLVNPQGYRLVPAIKVPPGATGLAIAANGTVTAQVGGTTTTLGQITLALFPNNAGLVQQAGGVYQPSANSGAPTVVVPGTGGSGPLVSGALNASGVSVSREMVALIQASSAYSLSAKLMTTAEVLDQATTQMNA